MNIEFRELSTIASPYTGVSDYTEILYGRYWQSFAPKSMMALIPGGVGFPVLRRAERGEFAVLCTDAAGNSVAVPLYNGLEPEDVSLLAIDAGGNSLAVAPKPAFERFQVKWNLPRGHYPPYAGYALSDLVMLEYMAVDFYGTPGALKVFEPPGTGCRYQAPRRLYLARPNEWVYFRSLPNVPNFWGIAGTPRLRTTVGAGDEYQSKTFTDYATCAVRVSEPAEIRVIAEVVESGTENVVYSTDNTTILDLDVFGQSRAEHMAGAGIGSSRSVSAADYYYIIPDLVACIGQKHIRLYRTDPSAFAFAGEDEDYAVVLDRDLYTDPDCCGSQHLRVRVTEKATDGVAVFWGSFVVDHYRAVYVWDAGKSDVQVVVGGQGVDVMGIDFYVEPERIANALPVTPITI